MFSLANDLRAMRATARNDILLALRSPFSSVIAIILPLNYLILLLLFALNGGQAPTAIVMGENGPYAQQFVDTMRHAHSFIITPDTPVSAEEAQNLIQTGKIVAVVTIPANFDTAIQQGKQIAIPVMLNNLNTDFTNDIRRAVPLTITQFYAKALPQQVVVQVAEHDLIPHDTDYIPYLSVSVFVIGLMISGLLVGGLNTTADYERQTIKEFLLSPASRWAIQVGKILGSMATTAVSSVLLLIVIVLVLGIQPDNWPALILFFLIMLPIFGTFGTLLGTLFKRRAIVIPLTISVALPLFFISGAFGPVTFGAPITAWIARLSPAYYGISVFQYAFHGFTITQSGVVIDTFVLIGFAVGAALLSAVALRRSSVSH
ncbi:MAG: ABC transporter permease [Anaerolineae bacterium]|nr:ABC transporter permease [Anaerolineae bacterium]